MTSRDPVERASHGSRDLYDVSTWEPRSSVDRFAVWLYRNIKTALRGVVIGVAALILIAVFSLGGLAAVFDPQIGTYVALSAVPALAFAAYVWKADVTSREPWGLLVATFVLAVLFAGFAGVLNSVFTGLQNLEVSGLALGAPLFFYFVVGPVEETVKLLAVWLYPFRSSDFDAVIDGAVYGAVAGLGFATIENALYISNIVLDSGSEVTLVGIAFVRSAAGPGHVIYSGIAGYYLGLAKFNRDNFGPIVVKGLAIAAFVHGTYNVSVGFMPGLLENVLGIGPGVAFLGYVVLYDSTAGYYLYRKIKTYRQTYHEVGAGEEYDEGDLSPELTEFDAPDRSDD